jgi:hypothetical protein
MAIGTSSVAVTGRAVPYAEALLTTAKQLSDQGQYSVAVIVAHMACEVAVERALTRAFAARKITYLEGPVEAFLSGYNLNNERIRKLYNALARDAIEAQPFWAPFKASADRRNSIMHGGHIATRPDAESSHKAASDLVAYLSKVSRGRQRRGR